MAQRIERVFVGPNKAWHKASCSRRVSPDPREELVLIARDVLGYWSTHNVYRCPECKAMVNVDN